MLNFLYMKNIALITLFLIFLLPTLAKSCGLFVSSNPVSLGSSSSSEIEHGDINVLLEHNGTEERLTFQVEYEGSANDFGWIIPLPENPEIVKGEDDTFEKLEFYTRPKEKFSNEVALSFAQMLIPFKTASLSTGSDVDMVGSMPSSTQFTPKTTTVEVLERKSIEDYEIAVLSSENENDLKDWLEENDYVYPENELGVIEDYINKKWVFVAIKMKDNGTKNTVPLSFTFDSSKMIVPMQMSSDTKVEDSGIPVIEKNDNDVVKTNVYVISNSKVFLKNYFKSITFYAEKLSGDESKSVGGSKNKGFLTAISLTENSSNIKEDFLFGTSNDNEEINAGTMGLADYVQIFFLSLISGLVFGNYIINNLIIFGGFLYIIFSIIFSLLFIRGLIRKNGRDIVPLVIVLFLNILFSATALKDFGSIGLIFPATNAILFILGFSLYIRTTSKQKLPEPTEPPPISDQNKYF